VRSRHAAGRPIRAALAVSPAMTSVLAAAVLCLAGCAGKGREASRSAIAREGTLGAHHFRVASVLEPSRVTLGQPSRWTLRAELPKEARAESLLRDPGAPTLDVIDRKPSAARGERGLIWSGAFEVRGFDLGRIPLPAMALVVRFPDRRDTLTFPIDTLAVDSLTQSSPERLEPDRGPIKPELRPIDIALAAGLALLLIATIVAIILAIRRRRRAAKGLGIEAAPEPPETPFLRAIEALRVEIESLPRDRFYDRLSLAIRAYVGAVTGIPALDRTTSELKRELERRPDVRDEAAALVERALQRSDLVRFARQEDPFAEAREALDLAASLAGKVMAPRPAPTTTPPSSSAERPGGTS
jgi:hypothetical protein